MKSCLELSCKQTFFIWLWQLYLKINSIEYNSGVVYFNLKITALVGRDFFTYENQTIGIGSQVSFWIIVSPEKFFFYIIF